MNPTTKIAKSPPSTATVTISGLRLTGSALEHGEYLVDLAAGEWEPYTAELFRDALEPGSVVVDGGAYLGFYSVLAAREVGPAGRVYSFEPNRRTFSYLRRNLADNEVEDRVLAFRAGLGDRLARRRFYLGDDDASRSSFFRPPGWTGYTEVPCSDLDRMLRSERVDVIKLDLEGGEVAALRGMRRTLARSRDARLFVECNPLALGRAREGIDTLLHMLDASGFAARAIDEDGRRLIDAEAGIAALEDHVNLFCSRRGS